MRFLVIATVISSIGLPHLWAAGPDFSHEIVPILRQHCGECHTGERKKGGFSMNTRAEFLRGGERGTAVVPGKSVSSRLIELVTTSNDDDLMPPVGGKRARLTEAQIAALRGWIDSGLSWEEGFAFKKPAYEPPLLPRKPELPAVVDARENPVDRIIDGYLAGRQLQRPGPIDDATFARRVHMDLVGLLPEPTDLARFVESKSPTKRAALVRQLLDDSTAYAEHWLTFWNDLLRNDYAGTGYIDGGRKQISQWLYRSLAENKPYDTFARELIAPPTAESEGFSRGIKWRGTVSAGQTVPVQFSQSVGQTFLGINLKCASCHDSFIDRWTLEESWGLAAVYSADPLELYRCDKPTGKKAKPAWLFPEIGQIDASQPPAQRLRQLANLMTHPKNGRFSRTIVNRLWHRVMGRGIVHPVDAMQSEPWNADLLDYLAVHLAENDYNLKKTLELICTSQAYQSQSEVFKGEAPEGKYVYAGPRAKRMTAEQFTDAIWQITGTAPLKFDAPVTRGSPDRVAIKSRTAFILTGSWIWSHDGVGTIPRAGEGITFRKTLELQDLPRKAAAVVSCDNSFVLYVNGVKLASSDDWQRPAAFTFESHLKKGMNEILVAAKNGGTAPNAAGFFFEGRLIYGTSEVHSLGSDATWEWTPLPLDAEGQFPRVPTDYRYAVVCGEPQAWAAINDSLKSTLAQAIGLHMVRASLLKSDLLMRTLGRPNREQIVSMRPADLTTLEAMDLNNAHLLNDRLSRGAPNLLKRHIEKPDLIINWVYRYALSRPPAPGELELARKGLGSKPTPQAVEDLLWSLFMLPEFQIVR